jgi:phage gp29-like protein
LARGAAWAFLFKSFTVKDWAIFCEAYGQPLRLGKYDAGATEKDKAVLLEAVTNIGTDYAAIVPMSMTIEFVTAQLAGSHELYEKRADWIDRQVSKLVLGQTATTDAIKGGYAVGKTHDGVRDDIEQADAIQLAGSLNRDLARPLVDLNFGPQKKYPRITIGRPEEEDVKALVDNVVKLVPLGLRVGKATMLDKIGLPEPAADEEILGAPEKKEEPPQKPAPGEKPKEGAFSARTDADRRDAVDIAIEETLSDWKPLVEPIVAELGEQLAAATSIEEARAILTRRFDGMDVAALTEKLAQAAFAARISGEADEPLS